MTSIGNPPNNRFARRPLQAYRREDGVERQLASLEGMALAALAQRVASGEGGPLHNETLVAAVRACVAGGRRDAAEPLLLELARRVAGRTQRHLDVWGVRGRHTREDLARDILLFLFDCVLSLSADQEFWECRFWTCFDRRARTLLRDSRVGGEVSLDDDPDGAARLPAPPGPDIEDRAIMAAALGALPEPVRTAFTLKHYGGYKEESGNPEEQTIARILGVSGRSVRSYLRRADDILAEWREDNADRR